MRQILTKIFHLAIALLIGALAITVYIQHRELAQVQQVDWSPIPMKPMTTPATSPTPYRPLFPPPPVQFGNRTTP